MKKRVFVLTCVHETKYGIDTYVSLHPSVDKAIEHVEVVKTKCEYDPSNYGEYFDFNFEQHVVDMGLFPDYAEGELL